MTSFVYFDLGGVLIFDLVDVGRWEQFKQHIGIVTSQNKAFENFYDKYELQMHIGKRDTDTLIPLIEERLVVIFAYVFLREKLTLNEKIGIILLISGAVLLSL